MRFKKPKFWDYKKISFLAILLLPLSGGYLILVWISRLFSILKVNKKLPIPTICVGNIYVGGTGKTPLVKEIYSITKSFGKNPAFVKKRYNYLLDEIKMLRDIGKTFDCEKRLSGIAQSIDANHDVAILDDGFQDFSIKPNLSILCFNSKQLIGNGFVIPSGPLRERFSSILRADCIIINGSRNIEFENMILKNIKKKIHIFYSNYKIKNLEKFKNKEITAFAGIGNPSNFFDLLIENNLNLKEKYSFPDHHNYSINDFEKILKNKSRTIITTEKDFYRLNKEQKENCYCVEVNLEIDKMEKFKKLIHATI
jgi:tetraacyldisaccharide 4'-kinase